MGGRRDYRVEMDSVGTRDAPGSVYYEVQSMRAAENSQITGLDMHPEIINSLAYIKEATAITNCGIKLLERKTAEAIVQACGEVLEGRFREDFVVDPVQDEAGTSLNMSANEVIANRTIKILGDQKDDYFIINPNDHVNCGQSTGDVIPAAGKVISLRLLKNLKSELMRLHKEFSHKAEELDHVIGMGRTQMQDAVPIRLGQEFRAYSVAVMRDIRRMDKAIEEICALNMGDTAIGTEVDTDEACLRKIVPNLAEVSNMELVRAFGLIGATQNLDPFVAVSGAVKVCVVTLSKITSDLRLMSSGPKVDFNEISLPVRQNGSSIVPGKVNPVIPEVVDQVTFNIIGNDLTITMAVETGQLELNTFEPIILYCMFQPIDTLAHAARTFVGNCISGIAANEERCRFLVENGTGIITAPSPHARYEKTTDTSKRALRTDTSVRGIILQEGLLDEEELDRILDPVRMAEPGISGKELLMKDNIDEK